MDLHTKSIEKVKEIMKTSIERGLTEAEAKKRLKEYGENEIKQTEKEKSVIRRFFDQLNDFLVLVLIGAAVISFVVSLMQGEKNFWDSVMIFGIVSLNAIIGVMQENKAQKTIDELRKLTPSHVKVFRDGQVKIIEAKNIVPGDILIFKTGDQICADARLIESISLKVEEAAITGESLAVGKDSNFICKNDTEIAERKNMVLSSSFVSFGRGKAIVVSTGIETEVGKIANLLQQEKEKKTPLQANLDKTGKILAFGAIGICAIIFILGVLRKENIFDMFMTSVSLAVAAIPEGLTAVVTIVLAMGTKRLSEKKAIVRKLTAVETLGSAQIICSDKTGTLTMNKMKVVKVRDLSMGENIEKETTKHILTMMSLCNDSVYKEHKFLGEATEVALAESAFEHGILKETINCNMPRVSEIPFSSERKIMTTVHKTKDGFLAITKGAPEILIELCTKVEINSKERMFDSTLKQKVYLNCDKMAGEALRVIGVATASFLEFPQEKELEKNLVLLGFTGIMDMPRQEVKQAVFKCKKAGIKPVMITGDNVITAVAIGKKVGIFEEGDESISGKEINVMSRAVLEKNIDRYSVFARVTPEHKMRIIKAFQAKGKIVAMTGDGVNDAPALKAADIGCAMGQTGTDAAKNAADMIIVDDNFNTIIEAVKEGRGIYENIKKTVHFLLSSNVGEIVTIFAAMVMGFETPLLPIQLLWVNLITDSLPAIALGLEKTEEDVLDKNFDFSRKDNIFANGLGFRIFLEGVMIGFISIIAFGIGHLYYDNGVGADFGRTMAFAVLSLSQLVHAFNIKSEKSIFRIDIFDNKLLYISFIIGSLLQFVVIMVEPVSSIFKVTPLNLEQWVLVWSLAFIPMIVAELEKFLIVNTNKEDFA